MDLLYGILSAEFPGIRGHAGKTGKGLAMKQKQFVAIRHHLGKTQNQMAQILGVSPKAIQSFEQGWRKIPVHVERQALVILALMHQASEKGKPCWTMRHCPEERKQECPAWQFNAGHLCWFINGTICEGRPRGNWKSKIIICSECEVYKSILPQKI
jgi:DNA-binding XRE family transcriptional regulator